MPKPKEKYYAYTSCDGCNNRRRVRRLNLSAPDNEHRSTAGIFLCEYCWRMEMDWRRHINQAHDPTNYGHKGPWPTYHFHELSPDGYDADISDMDEVGDMEYTAEPIYDPDTGEFEAYAITDGVNTVGFAKRGAIPKEYFSDVEKAEMEDYDRNIREQSAARDAVAGVDYNAEQLVSPLLSGNMTANPRLVLLWDRINGMATYESYGVWIVYSNNSTVLYGASVRGDKSVTDTIDGALIHAEEVSKNDSERSEYVVVALPNLSLVDASARDYAHKIGNHVMARNMQAFAERSRTK